MTDPIKIEFRPSETQEQKLTEIFETEGREAWFKARAEMEKAWQVAFKARIEEAAKKMTAEQNNKDQKELFAKMQKKFPNIKVDLESIKAHAPAYVLEEFEKGEISLENLILKSIGSQQAIAAVGKTKAQQQEVEDGTEKSADSIIDASEAKNSGEDIGINPPNLNSASGSTEVPKGATGENPEVFRKYTKEQGLSDIY